MKKRVIINKPEVNARGQYVFLNDGATEYSDSNSVPIRYDKFSDKDLYTTVKGNFINEKIIEGNFRYPGTSFLKIDELNIQNAGVLHWLNDINTYVFIFDNTKYESHHSDNPEYTDYSAIYGALFEGNTTNSTPLSSDSMIYSTTGGELEEGTSLGKIIEDATIISNLYTGGNYNGGHSGGAFSDYNENAALSSEETLLRFGEGQKIYIVIYTSGNADGSIYDSNRDNRIHVFSIDVDSELDDPVTTGGGEISFPFVYSDAVHYEGNNSGADLEAAFKVTSLKLTINSVNETSADVIDGSETYNSISGSILPSYTVNLNTFNSDILNINPNREIVANIPNETNFTPTSKVNILDNTTYNLQIYQTSPSDKQIVSAPTQISLDFDIATYNPSSEDFDLSILDGTHYIYDGIEELYDIYDAEIIHPAPNGCDNSNSTYASNPNIFDQWNCIWTDACKNYYKNVYDDWDAYCNSLNVDPYETINEFDYYDGEYVRETMTQYGKPNYMYYVLSWNDLDNKFENWEDIFQDLPANEFELLDKQKENLYQYTNVGTPSIHNYITPGIKIIKLVLFSYRRTGINEIEPIRWKFIKSKIFLDIPINQYPDFSEVGGADYTTIPWPYTTPVIGGTDEYSKYKISIRDTLSGGKIGEADIIDETFLVEANENNEIGQSIRKFDLEQVRYFNTGNYDITHLLGIQDLIVDGDNLWSHTNIEHWDGETNSFSEETSVGEIFINDSVDLQLITDCKLELNCGNVTGKAIEDSSGNSSKGLLIGDYKIKKTRKNRPMKRDSFIKIPKKNSNSNGAL